MLAKPISYRVPIPFLARVDSMAQQGGISRNSMLNMILEVGLEDVEDELPLEVYEEVLARENVVMQHLLDDSSNVELSE
jgi:predicted DNA-binding protein